MKTILTVITVFALSAVIGYMAKAKPRAACDPRTNYACEYGRIG